MKLPDWILTFLLLGLIIKCMAGNANDSIPDNLVHPPNYQMTTWGSLPFQKMGNGQKTLLILPGWGFDGSVFQEFIDQHLREYTVYLLTLPGFGTTPSYPMPPAGTSYGDGTWTKGVEHGILQLMELEKLERPVLVAHFLASTHIALDLAAGHPGKFEKVVVVGGPANFKNPPPYDTMSYKSRVRGVDGYLAPMWFKTVTQQTWRNGNFPPGVYSLDEERGKELFEKANETILPVQIRYLCENWAADFSSYERIQIPVLAVVPSFSPALLEDPKNQFLKMYTEEWPILAAKNKHIRLVEVEGTSCNVMQDQPLMLKKLLFDFLKE